MLPKLAGQTRRVTSIGSFFLPMSLSRPCRLAGSPCYRSGSFARPPSRLFAHSTLARLYRCSLRSPTAVNTRRVCLFAWICGSAASFRRSNSIGPPMSHKLHGSPSTSIKSRRSSMARAESSSIWSNGAKRSSARSAKALRAARCCPAESRRKSSVWKCGSRLASCCLFPPETCWTSTSDITARV